jgi:hypothetical protein
VLSPWTLTPTRRTTCHAEFRFARACDGIYAGVRRPHLDGVDAVACGERRVGRAGRQHARTPSRSVSVERSFEAPLEVNSGLRELAAMRARRCIPPSDRPTA